LSYIEFRTLDGGQSHQPVLGTRWRAEPEKFNERTLDRISDTSLDLLVGCVDTWAARSTIARALTKTRNRTGYWLDLGNNATSGQFVLGQPLNARDRRKAGRLRTVNKLYPEIVDGESGEDPLPSCSTVEERDRQEPFINQTLASAALRCWPDCFIMENLHITGNSSTRRPARWLHCPLIRRCGPSYGGDNA
jgi:PRTRC genetic system ThiF family protein